MKNIVLTFFFYLCLFSWAVQAEVLRINNFPQYEFYKYNFSYLNGQELSTLEAPSQIPVISLSFLDSDISAHNNWPVPVQWDRGISGKAPRFYGEGSEYPLTGWDSFFSRSRLSSFTLSFYFYPQTIMREEFLIQGIREHSSKQILLPTAFRVLLKKGRIHWELENFFTQGNKRFSTSLMSRLSIRYGEWNHIVLGYDVKNARLIMILNGEVVDFIYATADGKKSGPQYTAGFPGEGTSASDWGIWVMNKGMKKSPALESTWTLGKGFTGKIDEIELFDDFIPVTSHFQSTATSKPFYSVYASQVFRLDKITQISLAKIQGENILTPYVRLYLCQDKNFFPEHTHFTDCNQIYWNKEIVDYPKAEFYQFFLVYNNLEHSLKSIKAVEFTYKQDDKPLPPQWVTLKQTQDGILMEWEHTLEDIAGYRIYFRQGGFEGSKSMIELSLEELQPYKNRRELWTYVMDGLEKDIQYFFGIKSFDLRNGRIRESDFSPIKNLYNSSDFIY